MALEWRKMHLNILQIHFIFIMLKTETKTQQKTKTKKTWGTFQSCGKKTECENSFVGLLLIFLIIFIMLLTKRTNCKSHY